MSHPPPPPKERSEEEEVQPGWMGAVGVVGVPAQTRNVFGVSEQPVEPTYLPAQPTQVGFPSSLSTFSILKISVWGAEGPSAELEAHGRRQVPQMWAACPAPPEPL